jgi:hypothetical protein
MSRGIKVAVGVFVVFFAIGLATILEEPEPSQTLPASEAEKAANAQSQGTTSNSEPSPAELGAAKPDLEATLAALAKIKQSKQSKSVTSGEVTVTVTATKSGKKWIYDRNNFEYSYAEADKDSRYHWLDLDISSASKNPALPALFACRFSKAGEFEVCQPFRFEFHRWDDYGSYLGVTVQAPRKST